MLTILYLSQTTHVRGRSYTPLNCHCFLMYEKKNWHLEKIGKKWNIHVFTFQWENMGLCRVKLIRWKCWIFCRIVCKFSLQIVQSFFWWLKSYQFLSFYAVLMYNCLFVCKQFKILNSYFIFVAAFIQEMHLKVLYNKTCIKKTPSNIKKYK